MSSGCFSVTGFGPDYLKFGKLLTNMLIGITFQLVYIVFFGEHLTHSFIFRPDSKGFYWVGINNPKASLQF